MPKISQLEAATDITASDLIQVIDIEDTGMATSGTNKKATAQLVANNLAKIINDGAVITANTSTDAVRITQTGSGNALVVEDSANPDATPFVVTSAGNVGIGTATPTAKLDVNGDIKATQLNLNNPSGDSFIEIGGTGSVYIDLKKPNSDDYDLRIGTDGTNNVIRSVGDVSLTTADTERIRIGSNGNVGIGTGTPTGRLEVNGTGDNVVTLSGDSFVALSINSYRDSSSDHGMIIYKSARGTANSPAAVQSGDNTVTIASRPYDGITNLGTARIRFLVDGTVSSGVVPQGIRFSTGSTSLDVTDRVSIKSSGDVGIGTTDPSSKLHVAGDLTVSSATTSTSATAGTNGDVPAQVAGYLVVNINGTARKIPYYA